MAGSSYASAEDCVLLTAEGRDEKTGKVIDIEIAVPLSDVRELVGRIIERSGIAD